MQTILYTGIKLVRDQILAIK